jgi:ketosteroid isomerase-like protein
MRPFIPPSVAVLVVIVALTACAGANSHTSGTDVAAISRSIDSLNTKANRWFNAGATDSLVTGYYTSDAVVMSQNATADNGSDAIRKSLTDMFATSATRLHFHQSSLVASDSVASEQGQYTLEVRDKQDTSKVVSSGHGNYVTTFVKRNGQWRALYDIGTSDVPAAVARSKTK